LALNARKRTGTCTGKAIQSIHTGAAVLTRGRKALVDVRRTDAVGEAVGAGAKHEGETIIVARAAVQTRVVRAARHVDVTISARPGRVAGTSERVAVVDTSTAVLTRVGSASVDRRVAAVRTRVASNARARISVHWKGKERKGMEKEAKRREMNIEKPNKKSKPRQTKHGRQKKEERKEKKRKG
jgi:hypothetical protein